MAVTIRKAEPGDHPEWLRLRCALWPDCPAEEHVCEIANIMTRLAEQIVFVAVRPSGSLVGFIEVSMHATAVGCETGPVGYIEGWYVDPDLRRQGIGRKLVAAAEQWSLERGCREMASDSIPDNEVGVVAHRACGFGEVERLVHFRKSLIASLAQNVSDGSGI